MVRFLPCILWIASAVAAQDAYEQLLAEAVRLEQDLRIGETADVPLDRAYRKLAAAARLQPARWDAYALRGANRCTMAGILRRRLWRLLDEARSLGEPAEQVASKRQVGEIAIGRCIRAAQHDFQVMVRNMRALGQVDANRIRFASAAIKYARREYLRAKSGGGAIADFQTLVKRGWKVDFCSEFVARCYLELGVASLMKDKHEEAHRYWKQALRWARSGNTRRRILSNMAAAFDLDNEYGFAEKIVREQIEAEPARPVHWKNLGLMLGHQNKLRAALHAYRRARELCRTVRTPIPLGYFHGNAWLKAAMIHGKLLEEDGDLLLAWRLFLEYRAMFGDDYNFSVSFGEFAYQMGQYELAWPYLRRARDKKPFCIMAHALILRTALRMAGPPDVAGERIREARAAHQEALKRFRPRETSALLKRVCAGQQDRTGAGGIGEARDLLDPDPLAGTGPDNPPAWIVEAAGKRAPFRPYDPAVDAGGAATEPSGGTGQPRGGLGWSLLLLGVLVAGGAVLFLPRRGEG